MVNRRSPFLTGAPSSKWIFSKYPSTRATSVTESLAAVLPVKLRYSVTLWMTGLETVTVADTDDELPGLARHPSPARVTEINTQIVLYRKRTYESPFSAQLLLASFDSHEGCYHSGNRTGGPRSCEEGSPGACGCSNSGLNRVPQLVRSRISCCVSAGTKSLPSRICQPPPRARYV